MLNTIYFWLSKLIWYLIAPLNLILIVLVVVWICQLLKFKKVAGILFSYVIISLIFLSLFPVGNWLLEPLEDRYTSSPMLPGKIEGIIVLGGSIDPGLSHYWGQVETGGAIERELTFLHLAKKYPEAKLIYTGGSSSLVHHEFKEADEAEKFFEYLDFDTSRIMFDRDARNTYENARLTIDKFNPEMKLPWVLITSAYHMPRSMGTFCALGWKVIPYPVDHRTQNNSLTSVEFNLTGHMLDINLAIHEWLGLYVYYLTGKTTTIFPDKCN